MWKYEQPVTIEFGNNSIERITSLIHNHNWKRGILIITPHFVKNGLAEQIITSSKGTIFDVFSHITPNPDVIDVDKCAEIVRQKKHDFVIALGGGSTIDLAKAVASISQTNESISAYHGTGKTLPSQHLPLIAVPTTSGTGSEVTSVSVLSNHKLNKKAPIVSNNFFPTYAIIDPTLTYDMPPYLTACCGIDVLSHALEGYWSKHHQPICNAYAIYAANLVFRYLPQAYQNPQNTKAREKMNETSVIAGLAFTLPKTTSSHACSFPLTNIYNIPHGEACGLTLDYFARLNGKKSSRIQNLAISLDFANSETLADAILNLKQQLNLRCDLKDLNLTDKQIDELVQASHHPNLDNNPITVTDEILYDMYNSMR